MTEQEREIRDAGTPRRPSQRRRDGGFTYVEVVITLVLMGVVILPILAAVRASIEAASVSQAAAEVETVLVNAADRVTRADRDDFKCDLTAVAQQAADIEWGDPSAITVEHAHWDRGLGDWVADPGGSACPGGAWQNDLIQRIRIRVSSPDRDVVRTLEVVKGDF